jgi:hypothetical protein
VTAPATATTTAASVIREGLMIQRITFAGDRRQETVLSTRPTIQRDWGSKFEG